MNLNRRNFLAMAAAGGAMPLAVGPAHAQKVKTSANIVIIGAGAAGSALSNRLVNRLDGAKITIIDPSKVHTYQPGLTLVATGLKPKAYVTSGTTDWLPSGVDLVQEAATAIDPVAKTVSVASGKAIPYDYLVVATGLVLDYASIEGFSTDMIGKDGIGGIYANADFAARTWEAVSKFAATGGNAVIMRPATEMKCAGAPLKHAFLVDDITTRTAGAGKHKVHYFAPQTSLFGVPIVAEKVRMVFGDRGITPYYSHTLKAVDAGRKVATFVKSAKDAASGLEATSDVEVPYDYLHVIPPQRAPDFVRQSGLSWVGKWDDQGWVEADQKTLRHPRFPEVFSLGDVAGVPKGKTAASVKWQVPVVEDHLVAAIEGKEGTAVYDGYTSCPLITKVGRAMLIEFDYKNNLVPSFPGVIAPLEELWISWLMKELALKPTYNAMLRGEA